MTPPDGVADGEVAVVAVLDLEDCVVVLDFTGCVAEVLVVTDVADVEIGLVVGCVLPEAYKLSRLPGIY